MGNARRISLAAARALVALAILGGSTAIAASGEITDEPGGPYDDEGQPAEHIVMVRRETGAIGSWFALDGTVNPSTVYVNDSAVLELSLERWSGAAPVARFLRADYQTRVCVTLGAEAFDVSGDPECFRINFDADETWAWSLAPRKAGTQRVTLKVKTSGLESPSGGLGGEESDIRIFVVEVTNTWWDRYGDTVEAALVAIGVLGAAVLVLWFGWVKRRRENKRNRKLDEERGSQGYL